MFAILLLTAPRLRAQEPSDESTLARFDSGPATIDVSGYPADMQAGYKVFAQRCTKCHTLSRPINSDYATSDEWSRYVKRMMRKPGSGINKKDAKTIFDFLVYDSSIRKKDLLAEKKAAQSGGE
jgi:mono/diheme cytochrome c family protein